jgi:hypothetical protein
VACALVYCGSPQSCVQIYLNLVFAGRERLDAARLSCCYGVWLYRLNCEDMVVMLEVEGARNLLPWSENLTKGSLLLVMCALDQSLALRLDRLIQRSIECAVSEY